MLCHLLGVKALHQQVLPQISHVLKRVCVCFAHLKPMCISVRAFMYVCVCVSSFNSALQCLCYADLKPVCLHGCVRTCVCVSNSISARQCLCCVGLKPVPPRVCMYVFVPSFIPARQCLCCTDLKPVCPLRVCTCVCPASSVHCNDCHAFVEQI